MSDWRVALCVRCGEVFERKRSNQLICSGPHRYSCEECSKVFTLPGRKQRKTCSSECRKALTARVSGEAMMERYGVRCAANLDGQAAARGTKARLYGSETYNNRAKARETSLERYGVENHAQLPESRERSRALTYSAAQVARQVYSRRGVSVSELPESEELIAAYEIITSPTALKEFSFRLKEELGRKLRYLDVRSRLGCSAGLLSKHLSSAEWFSEVFSSGESYLEAVVVDYLGHLGFKESGGGRSESPTFRRRDRSLIAPQELDIVLPDFSLALEVQDFATHSRSSDCELPRGVWASRLPVKRGPSYHAAKERRCAAVGVKLLELWEDEILEGSFERRLRFLVADGDS